MSARAVVSGVLFRAPASKTSRAGRPYIFATIREGAGDAIRWWKCFAFSESAIEEFSCLVGWRSNRCRGGVRLRTLLAGVRRSPPQLEDRCRRGSVCQGQAEGETEKGAAKA